jgi:hypothetical protein
MTPRLFQPSFAPAACYDQISIAQANQLLRLWQHKLGPIRRGNQPTGKAWALFVAAEPVAVAVQNDLIADHPAGLLWATREITIELSRLAAAGPQWSRVILRLWREISFPDSGRTWAVSYQDTALHTGNLYRFDGWTRASYASSGPDRRSGRKARNKWVWIWPKPHTQAQEPLPCRPELVDEKTPAPAPRLFN